MRPRDSWGRPQWPRRCGHERRIEWEGLVGVEMGGYHHRCDGWREAVTAVVHEQDPVEQDSTDERFGRNQLSSSIFLRLRIRLFPCWLVQVHSLVVNHKSSRGYCGQKCRFCFPQVKVKDYNSVVDTMFQSKRELIVFIGRFHDAHTGRCRRRNVPVKQTS
jgi:hypothetical protein